MLQGGGGGRDLNKERVHLARMKQEQEEREQRRQQQEQPRDALLQKQREQQQKADLQKQQQNLVIQQLQLNRPPQQQQAAVQQLWKDAARASLAQQQVEAAAQPQQPRRLAGKPQHDAAARTQVHHQDGQPEVEEDRTKLELDQLAKDAKQAEQEATQRQQPQQPQRQAKPQDAPDQQEAQLLADRLNDLTRALEQQPKVPDLDKALYRAFLQPAATGTEQEWQNYRSLASQTPDDSVFSEIIKEDLLRQERERQQQQVRGWLTCCLAFAVVDGLKSVT